MKKINLIVILGLLFSAIANADAVVTRDRLESELLDLKTINQDLQKRLVDKANAANMLVSIFLGQQNLDQSEVLAAMDSDQMKVAKDQHDQCLAEANISQIRPIELKLGCDIGYLQRANSELQVMLNER